MLNSKTVHFLGVRVDNYRLREALARVKFFIDSKQPERSSRKVYFTNVHTIHLARRDPQFFCTIHNADLVLPDGSGIDLAGRILKRPVKENLNGTDFMPVVLRMAERYGYTVYLLGARPEVLERCVERIQNDFSDLKLIGYQHGYYHQQEEGRILEKINRVRPDILLVATGSPRQEKWIASVSDHLEAGVCFAVGGLFDFLSGEFSRAPYWMRKAGLEWVHRFVKNPREKWNRIVIEIPLFIWLTMMNRLFHSSFHQS